MCGIKTVKSTHFPEESKGLLGSWMNGSVSKTVKKQRLGPKLTDPDKSPQGLEEETRHGNLGGLHSQKEEREFWNTTDTFFSFGNPKWKLKLVSLSIIAKDILKLC